MTAAAGGGRGWRRKHRGRSAWAETSAVRGVTRGGHPTIAEHKEAGDKQGSRHNLRHSYFMACYGACGKPWVVSYNRRPRPDTDREEQPRMGGYVLGFQEIDQTQIAAVGGKGARLGELARIADIRVPVGFCVTTDAFQRIMTEAPSIGDLLDRLSRLQPDDRETIRAVSAEIRQTLEATTIPDDLAMAITS